MAQSLPISGAIGGVAQPVITGRRGRSRLKVRLLARLSTRTDNHRVILNDLSLTGAQLSISEPLRLGTDAVLEWGPHDAFGEIVWSDGARAGMRFDEPLDPGALIATRDLDDAEHLPSEFELARRVAQAWAQGVTPR